MFGVGLGFLMRSAARQGLPFGRLYRNRMLGLMILGIAHGCLLFPGDIQTICTVTGETDACTAISQTLFHEKHHPLAPASISATRERATAFRWKSPMNDVSASG